MLYKKNQAEKLEDSLFEQPTAEYRGATPFGRGIRCWSKKSSTGRWRS